MILRCLPSKTGASFTSLVHDLNRVKKREATMFIRDVLFDGRLHLSEQFFDVALQVLLIEGNDEFFCFCFGA